jgi:hypothetical protein
MPDPKPADRGLLGSRYKGSDSVRTSRLPTKLLTSALNSTNLALSAHAIPLQKEPLGLLAAKL